MKTVRRNRVLSILLCAVLLLGATPMFCFAEGGAAVSVSSASGKAGDEVTINVNLTENPGVVAMALNVNYDANQLELVSADNAGILSGFSSPAPSDNSGSYLLNWEDGLAQANNSTTGTVATLKFRLKEDCDTASVNVSGNGYDFDIQPVSVSSGKGTITNTNPTTTTTTAPSTTAKPTTTKAPATKATTTKASATTAKSTTRSAATTAAYTRSYNTANTYPVDFEVPTTAEAESTTDDFLDLWGSTTEWTFEMFTEETTTEPMTEAEIDDANPKLSRTKLILIVLMACFAIIGVAIIVSMVRKSKG